MKFVIRKWDVEPELEKIEERPLTTQH